MDDERKRGSVPTSTYEQKAQFKVLEKMLIAALICCIFGAVEMYLFRYIWLSVIFIFTILTMLICAVLLKKAKISAEFAALMPILIFCFVYTPASWYTFDGLMGNTPYLTIIFTTVILLTNYRRGTKLLIGLYCVTLMGLTIDWLLRFKGTLSTISVLSTLMAWILVLSVIVLIVGNTQKQSLEYNRKMFDRSIRDALTGLYNRNAMEPILEYLESQYSAHGSDYIAMMFDIDQFKQANDLYGHAQGDAALKIVAARILETIRETDFALRFGGDEFLVLLPVSAKGDSHQMIDRISRSVCSITGLEFPIMVSTGNAYRSECTDQAALLALSDQRMYLEKQSRCKSSDGASPVTVQNRQDAENMNSGKIGEMKTDDK
jgi:diguanylate cyclase (GGDEF)-like protein